MSDATVRHLQNLAKIADSPEVKAKLLEEAEQKRRSNLAWWEHLRRGREHAEAEDRLRTVTYEWE